MKGCITEKKMGIERAQKVLKAFESNPQHFGFIKVSEEKLAELTSLPNIATAMGPRNTFSFRAGSWVVLIVDQHSYLEVSVLNPYDLDDHFTVVI